MLIKIGSALIDPEEIAAISPYRDESMSDVEKSTHVCVVFKRNDSLWIDATMDEAEAALIDAGVVTDLVADDGTDEEPVPLITHEEKVQLYELEEEGYKYLARDRDGKLYAFRRKPENGGFYWSDPGPGSAGALQVIGFNFVSEDDEEPTEIGLLLD